MLEKIVHPVITGMNEEGTPFRGFSTRADAHERGPRVLEFNVRMGDPEAQVILPRLDSDLALLCESLCPRQIAGISCCLVRFGSGLRRPGFRRVSGTYEKGKIISGLKMAEEDQRVSYFPFRHAATGGISSRTAEEFWA